MTLEDYCKQLGWNASDLAREARIDRRTAQRALEGDTVTSRAARGIAEALSASIGKRILVGDIEGLHYR